MVVEEVVVAVRVDVCGAVLLMEMEAGESPQVVGLVAPAGELVMEQARETVPVNELDGVTVIVEVLPVVAPGATVMFPLFESVKSLLPFGASQNPEHPGMNAMISGAITSAT